MGRKTDVGTSASPDAQADVRALRRRIEELEQTESRFRELVDRSPQAVLVHDDRVRYANEAAVRLFGFRSADEMLALPRFDLLYAPESRPLARARREARLRNEPVAPTIEVDLLDPAGGRRRVMAHTREILWAGHRAVHSAYTDLTEIRRIEAELAEDRQLLRTVLDTVPHWVVVKDRDQRHVLANQAVFRDFHVTPEELYGTRVSEIGPQRPDELALVERTDRDVLEWGHSVIIDDLPYTLPDGRVQRRHLIKTPLRDADGGMQGVVSVSMDLTEQWEARQRLRRSEERLRTLVDHLPVMLVTCDSEGLVTAVEGAGSSALQGSGEQVGRPLAELLEGEPELVAALQRALAGEPVQAIWHTTGRAFDARFVPLREDGGQPRGVLWLALEVTERVQAQRQAESTRRLLQTVMDTLPLLVFVKDRAGRYLLVNRTKLDLYGVSAADLIGRPFKDVPIATPDQREAMHRSDLELFHTGRRQDQPEVQVTLPDGRSRILRQIKVPLRDEQGEIFGLVGVAEDITEAQLAAQELQAHRRLLQAVFDVVPTWLFVKDPESRFLMVNETMARQIGRAASDFVGMAHEVATQGTPDERQHYREDDLRVIRTGIAVEVEEPLTLPGGEAILLHSRKMPLRDEQGEVIGLVGMSEDITDRRQAEDELRAQRRLLQTVFDTIPTWLFVKDRDGRYVMVNDVFARDVGRTPESFRGLEHERAPQGTVEQRSRIRELERRVIETGRPFEGEEELTLPDGRLTYRFVRKEPLRDDRGNIVGIVGISEDITERRKLEEQIRRMQRIESIGTLAGGIAHDFNNILFPILGFTELTLLDLDPDAPAHRHLTTVRDAALRAKDIVAQILAFSRQAENKPERVQMRPLIHESLRFLGSTLPSTVHIEEDLAPEVSPVYADGVQMHQVLMNLCVNAAHAMPDGGVLRVSLHNCTLDHFKGYTGDPVSGPFVRLAVQDSGTGIDTVTLARIFEPFFTTKAVGHGTGLGLSTVLGIVTQHKGVINVVTAPGEGSTFEIYLPEATHRPQPEAPELKPTQAPTQASILYVDDEPPILELVCHVLEKQGHRVVAMTSSPQALERFSQNPTEFDLLITDQTLPDMTGDRLAASIRAIRPDLPIVIGTGNGYEIPAHVLDELKIAEVFVKPVSGAQLAGIVERVLSSSGPKGITPTS